MQQNKASVCAHYQQLTKKKERANDLSVFL